jgi:hypothetical protein
MKSVKIQFQSRILRTYRSLLTTIQEVKRSPAPSRTKLESEATRLSRRLIRASDQTRAGPAFTPAVLQRGNTRFASGLPAQRSRRASRQVECSRRGNKIYLRTGLRVQKAMKRCFADGGPDPSCEQAITGPPGTSASQLQALWPASIG